MKHPISTLSIKYEQDVVFSRQRARQIAKLLGFDHQDQTRIATAVSEITRNAFKYARDGKVEFLVEDGDGAQFCVRVTDRGPGIANLEEILRGDYQSPTGMGMGVLGARRLMDLFEMESYAERGTTVNLGKTIPPTSNPRPRDFFAHLGEQLTKLAPQGPLEEIRQQNQELLHALEVVQQQRQELSQLNQELEATNSGVVALYAELDEKAGSLQRANDLKTRFISNMSHEVRTPLNSVLSLSRMLLERLDGDLNEEQERQVGYIKKSTEELYDLVNDLLDIAKIDAGKTIVRVDTFELREAFAALRGMFRPFITDKVLLHIEDTQHLPRIQSDRGKVAQILRNLVSNALKFTLQGEVRVSAVRLDEENLVIFVSDTGIGVAPEDQERIFEEFTQIESPLQRQTKGTGLGLPLSKKTARFLGGDIEVESSGGKGAVFKFRLPIIYRKKNALEENSPARQMGFVPHPSVSGILKDLRAQEGEPAFARKMDELEKSANAEKILIIDDSEIARYLLRDILEDEGYATIETASGDEGIALARKYHPKAVFLDLVMPGMNGFQVLAALRAEPATRDIPVIINTSELLGEDDIARLTTAAAAIVLKDMAIRVSTSDRIREALGKAGLPTRKAVDATQPHAPH